MNMPTVKRSTAISGREVGSMFPPYVVAEMSGNHNGSLENAFRILDAAKACGADAVKIQTYTADTITIDCDSPEFFIDAGLWKGRRLFELYEEAHTPWEWHAPIFEYAQKIGITVFSSPFDSTAVELLESLGCPAYKIASPELVDLALIKRVAKTGKPIILSTGAATFEEIDEAITTARSAGAEDIIVLHCTAAYPAPIEEANLLTIPALEEKFNVIVGLSDHTLGTSVSSVAVSLGASLIEKHFVLSREQGGVDSSFSLEPNELTDLILQCRSTKLAMGVPTFGPTQSEEIVRRNRRSLYVVKPIRRGELISHENVRSIRPGNGLKPKYLDIVMGKKATRDLAFGEPFSLEMIEA
jgi:pseudaminic acid synthase